MMIVVKARVANGPILTVKGRDAWALLQLHAANENGCTPIDHPGPRWSGYVHKLRNAGIVIETIRENHGGPFAGQHARYLLRSPVTILETEGGIVMAIAGLQIVAGGVSAPPALKPLPTSRTITNGFLDGEALETPIKVVEGGAS